MTDKIRPFGEKDIVDVLKFYCGVFPENPIFKVALEEIERLRKELEKNEKDRR